MPAGGAGAAVAEAPRRERRPLRVLVADDHPIHQAVARRLLERQGHAVTLAPDGTSAITAFEAQPYDAVLLLSRLPDMAACDAMRALRAVERERGLEPARMVAMRPEHRDATLDDEAVAGADDTLPRPLRLAELSRVLERPEPQERRTGPGRHVDPACALDRAGGSLSLLREVGWLCVASLPRHAAAIERALEAGDLEGLARAAHSVKGMVANFGAEAVTDEARRLQEAGRSGDAAAAADAWERLRGLLEELGAELTEMAGETTR